MTQSHSLLPGLYWKRKPHSSWILPDVQYATLWLFSAGRFRYINCWPGYSWFSASGTWEEQDGQLYCQGHSRGWSDAFADNHSNRDYAVVYTLREGGQQLVPGKEFLSTLTRVSHETVDSYCNGLDEHALPQCWQDFSTLMWTIEQHLGLPDEETNCPR